jgi:membrane-associated phospholipid phosphatase/protein-S-isoprenylcysteine O-methyltransferase Ste14
MEDRGGTVLGKIAYGSLFVVGVPALLVAWAHGTAAAVTLAPIRSLPFGVAFTAIGLAFVLSGMWALRVHGGGLPMNAFPPPRYVDRGAYAIVPHPIYVGFCGVVVGVCLLTGSASGLWLVAPTAILGCVALVYGYEKHDLEARFGPARAKTAIRLPEASEDRPVLLDRASVHLLVLGPWVGIYEIIAALGTPPDAVATFLPGEARWPVLEWAELFYFTMYPGVILVTLVARTKATLRRFAVRGLLSMAIVFPLFLALPFVAPPRPFTPTTLLGDMLVFERAVDTAACAFPSYHVVFAIFAAAAFAETWPRARAIAWAWGAGVGFACVATGMHTVVDVIGGIVTAVAVIRARDVWEALRSAAERVAGSWHEWRLGPLRVINHGLYGGLATAAGCAIAGTLAGPRSAAAMALGAACTVLFAGLWAQVIEGSPQLLRPYGYYGGVIGIIVGSMLAPLVGTPTWVMLAACATAGPWIQSIGRLRCLVQGCCHGAPCDPAVGIRYTHPRSRVCKLAHLVGVPVHPTPLYSILWNVVIFAVMARLWSVHAPLRFIGGLYLVMTGLGRFVEEHYRGEPQTMIRAGLRLYQWIAIVTVLAGIVVTVIGPDGGAPSAQLSWPPLAAALVMGLLAGAALGVDFPSSNRRFSRLV